MGMGNYKSLVNIHRVIGGMQINNDGFPDIQNMISKRHFLLTRVGITGLKKPTVVERNGRRINLIPTFDVYVDLPAYQKGSHMSRNAEVINKIVDMSVRTPVKSLEELASKIVEELLATHDYASFTQVDMSSDYFLEKSSPLGRKSLENYKIKASARMARNGQLKKTLGVEVVGMTVCPCAMEITREMISSQYPKDKETISEMPMLTHNQRNISSIELEIPPEVNVEADDLVDIIESSQSSPTFEILKRSDEGKVVLNAHKNPKFVEDVVRDILYYLLERYPNMPGNAKVKVKSISEESIHKHNAIAERVTTFTELRK